MRTIQENLALLQSNKIAIKTSLQNKVGGGVISDDMSTYSEKIDETNNQLKGMLGMNQEFSIDLTGSGLTVLRYGCFARTKITGCILPTNLTTIQDYAFYQCTGLGTMVIPNNVTTIPYNCFSGCSGMTSVTFGSSVATFGNSALYGCTSLTSLTLPASVTSIGISVFASCSHLESITILATTPPTLSNANSFASTNDFPIYVPSDSVAAYKAASNWNSLSSRIQAIPEPD